MSIETRQANHTTGLTPSPARTPIAILAHDPRQLAHQTSGTRILLATDPDLLEKLREIRPRMIRASLPQGGYQAIAPALWPLLVALARELPCVEEIAIIDVWSFVLTADVATLRITA